MGKRHRDAGYWCATSSHGDVRFWDRLLASRGGTLALDMFIGEGKWDGLLVHMSQPNLTDVTPFHMLLHVAGLHNPAAKGWRGVSQADMDSHRNATEFPDNVHNTKTVCKLTFQDPNWGRCRMRSTVYEAQFQLCPSGVIRRIQHKQRAMYRGAVSGLNDGFPRSSYKHWQAAVAANDSAGAARLEAELEAAYPSAKRLRNVLERGECALFTISHANARSRGHAVGMSQWNARVCR